MTNRKVNCKSGIRDWILPYHNRIPIVSIIDSDEIFTNLLDLYKINDIKYYELKSNFTKHNFALNDNDKQFITWCLMAGYYHKKCTPKKRKVISTSDLIECFLTEFCHLDDNS